MRKRLPQTFWLQQLNRPVADYRKAGEFSRYDEKDVKAL